MVLFSYKMIFDDGSAPNPFGGVCSLAICKPVIRRTAQINDWILGFGSKTLRNNNKLIYAMKVDSILSWKQYNTLCLNDPILYQTKLPSTSNKNGDCLYYYDYGAKTHKMRNNYIHTTQELQKDVDRGKNVLLSEHFYYFGSAAIEVPDFVSQIIPISRGHKSKKNDGVEHKVIDWLQKMRPGVISSPTQSPTIHHC